MLRTRLTRATSVAVLGVSSVIGIPAASEMLTSPPPTPAMKFMPLTEETKPLSDKPPSFCHVMGNCPKPKPQPVALPRTHAPGPSTGRCGGSLPSCSIMYCESKGDIRAENPRSSASGKWQVIDSTWGGYGGYSRASEAPEHVQDEHARKLWAGGAGRGHWGPCL